MKSYSLGRSTFVDHRVSTICQADQILVVEAGRIVEQGTQRSLYGQRGRYFDLYTKQHGLESNLLPAAGEGDNPDEKNTRKQARRPVRSARWACCADRSSNRLMAGSLLRFALCRTTGS